MTFFEGPPSQPTNITFSDPKSNTTYHLIWNAPNDTVDCVSYYLINTTSSEMLLTTTNTSVLITRPAEDPTNTTYTVSVAAVDTNNTIGQWSDPHCYLFQGLPVACMVDVCFVNHPLSICQFLVWSFPIPPIMTAEPVLFM